MPSNDEKRNAPQERLLLRISKPMVKALYMGRTCEDDETRQLVWPLRMTPVVLLERNRVNLLAVRPQDVQVGTGQNGCCTASRNAWQRVGTFDIVYRIFNAWWKH